jgi:hypothetical protein
MTAVRNRLAYASMANIVDSENCRNKEKGEKGKFIAG